MGSGGCSSARSLGWMSDHCPNAETISSIGLDSQIFSFVRAGRKVQSD